MATKFLGSSYDWGYAQLKNVGNPAFANDAANKQYVDQAAVPPGTVIYTACVTPPTGYLLCDGRSTGISRTTYNNLFAALQYSTTTTVTVNSGITTITVAAADIPFIPVGSGLIHPNLSGNTTVSSVDTVLNKLSVSPTPTSTGTATLVVLPWGPGDGGSTFNLPDLVGIRANSQVGIQGARQLSYDSAVGSTGGAMTHAHNMSNHTHTIASHDHPMPHSHGISGLYAAISVNSAGQVTVRDVSDVAGDPSASWTETRRLNLGSTSWAGAVSSGRGVGSEIRGGPTDGPGQSNTSGSGQLTSDAPNANATSDASNYSPYVALLPCIKY